LSKEKEAEIREMAKLSLLSNRINPIQEKNLKLFPLVFFNDVKSATVEYDFHHNRPIDFELNKEAMEIQYKFNDLERTHFKVTYRVEFGEDGLFSNPNITARYDALEAAVRGLFWKNTTVVVYFGDNKAFESVKNEQG
jgi:hypothetical protein